MARYPVSFEVQWAIRRPEVFVRPESEAGVGRTQDSLVADGSAFTECTSPDEVEYLVAQLLALFGTPPPGNASSLYTPTENAARGQRRRGCSDVRLRIPWRRRSSELAEHEKHSSTILSQTFACPQNPSSPSSGRLDGSRRPPTCRPSALRSRQSSETGLYSCMRPATPQSVASPLAQAYDRADWVPDIGGITAGSPLAGDAQASDLASPQPVSLANAQAGVDSMRRRPELPPSLLGSRRHEEPLARGGQASAPASPWTFESRRHEEARRVTSPLRSSSPLRASSVSGLAMRSGATEPTMLSRIDQFRRDVLAADDHGSEASSQQTSKQFHTGSALDTARSTSSSQRAGDAFAALRAIGALREGGFVSAGDGSLTTALHAVADISATRSRSVAPAFSRRALDRQDTDWFSMARR